MPVSLYMDVHVPRAITVELRRRGVSLLTAQEDGATTLPDADLLDRATRLERVLFTMDDDLLQEAARRQRAGSCQASSASPIPVRSASAESSGSQSALS